MIERRFLHQAVPALACILTIGCKHTTDTTGVAPLPGQSAAGADQMSAANMSPQHKQALIVAAKGEGMISKNPAEAVKYLRHALDLEPSSRQYQGSLAFALYRAGDTPAAIKLWKSLVSVNDKEGTIAAKWLAKLHATSDQPR